MNIKNDKVQDIITTILFLLVVVAVLVALTDHTIPTIAFPPTFDSNSP